MSVVSIFSSYLVPRTFLKELEAYTDCPELVGRCFLERVSADLYNEPIQYIFCQINDGHNVTSPCR